MFFKQNNNVQTVAIIGSRSIGSEYPNKVLILCGAGRYRVRIIFK